MRLTDNERTVQRDIEKWQHGDASLVAQAMNWAMAPMDWVVNQIVPDEVVDQVDKAVSQFLSLLNDASAWTYDPSEVVSLAVKKGIKAETVLDLQNADIAKLDKIAQGYFSENAILIPT